VFTGAQPASGDQVVTHVYEILPDPYVPFTRYDDDLGPIQGRRRSVKNEGQVARLGPNQRVTYEAREGSAIVYTEIEEEWSIETDEDGNSLFPIKDRDFYESSRGAVQERRQLFVPTGEEEGTLENVNGVITQTSYEPYNEFLSVKIVQTYKVNGPQLVGRATDNDGQLVTVTTQRKGALGYIPPNPTATRTVEVNREDAESLVERIVDTPEIFTAQTFSVERPDPIPQKFRVAVPIQTSQEVVEGQAELPELLTGEISRNEEQRNKFIKRVSATSRDQAVLPQTLLQKSTDNDRQEVTISETLQLGDTNETATATTTISSEALGDGNFVVTKTEVPEVFAGEVYRKTKDDLTPQKFRGAQEDLTLEETVEGLADPNITLGAGEFAKSEQQVNKFIKRVSTTSRAITTAVTLLEKVLTPDGQVGTRTLTLDSGDQSFTPSALLIDASVEALGDGRTVKTETTIPQIFTGASIQKTKIDLTPQKFRAAQEDTITEENVTGTINPSISLGAGEFAKSEQQVTQFVKRVSTNTRDISASTELTETIITPQGQVAERTLRLSAEPQTIQPDELLIDGSIEALGDGRTIKTETKVGGVFEGKSLSLERPDVTPQKFRAAIPSTTLEKTIAGAVVDPIVLAGNQISKSEQQVTEFIKRVRTEERDPAAEATLTGGKIYTSELGGGIAEVTESYSSDGDIGATLNTVSVSSENLGDNKFVSTKVELPNIPTLVGQEYDELLDVAIPYTQTVVETLAFVPQEPEVGVSLVPRNNLQTVKRTVDKTKSRQALLDFNWTFGSTVNISLPDTLLGVRCINSISTGGGFGEDDIEISPGTTLTLVRGGWYSVVGNIVFDIKEGYSGPADANRHVFFLDRDSATLTNVINRLNTLSIYSGSNMVEKWPRTKPVRHTLIVSGGKVEVNFQSLINGVEDSPFVETILGGDNAGSVTVTETPIPPTLHENIPILFENISVADLTGEGGSTPSISPIQPTVSILGESRRPSVEPLSIPATSPPSFDAGNYLVSVDTEPYRFGLVRVSAVVSLITSDYL
jgi:hypothetical protein